MKRLLFFVALTALLASWSGCATYLAVDSATRPQFDWLGVSYSIEGGASIDIQCDDASAEVKGFDRCFALATRRAEVAPPSSVLRDGDSVEDAWILDPLARVPVDGAEGRLRAVVPCAIAVGHGLRGAFVIAAEPAGWRRYDGASFESRRRRIWKPVVGVLLVVGAVVVDAALWPLELACAGIFLLAWSQGWIHE